MKNVSSTIIIPTFNSERYLKRTLHCLSRSTFKDFSVLIVDDNSTDSTIEIAESFSTKLNLKIIVKPKGAHKGAASSLNLAFNEVTTPFTALIDSDSYLAADWLETMQKKCQHNLICGAPILAFKDSSLGYLVGLEIESRYYRLREGQRLLHLSTCNLYAPTADLKGLRLDPLLYYGYDHQLSYLLNKKGLNFSLIKSTHCLHHNKTSFWGIVRQQYFIAVNQFILSLRFPKESSRKDDISPLTFSVQIPITLLAAVAAFWYVWAAIIWLVIIALLNLYFLNFLIARKHWKYLFPALLFIWARPIIWTIGVCVALIKLMCRK